MDATAAYFAGANMDATAANYGGATMNAIAPNYGGPTVDAAAMNSTAENYGAAIMDATAADYGGAATMGNYGVVTYAGEEQQQPKRGRRKIVIEKIKGESSRNVTFSKRKKGLFTKAAELSTLCGVDVAVVLFSQHDKPYCYGNPDVDLILNRYLAGPAGNNSGYRTSGNNDIRARAEKEEYAKALTRLDEEKMAAKTIGKANMNGESQDLWWEAPIDAMQVDELALHESKLQELRNMVIARLNMLGC